MFINGKSTELKLYTSPFGRINVGSKLKVSVFKTPEVEMEIWHSKNFGNANKSRSS